MYENEDGSVNRLVCRTRDKGFPQYRPAATRDEVHHVGSDGHEWTKGLRGTKVVPYHLPEVIEAVEQGDTIWIAEGEKDVEALRAHGLVATCNPMGAEKWRDELSEYLRGASVIIVWDRDAAGRRHALQVADSLKRVGAHVHFRRAAEGKDVSDHLDAGYSLADLVAKRPRDPDAQRHADTDGAGGADSDEFSRVLHALEDYATANGLSMPQRRSDGSYQACCPCPDHNDHGDHDPSLNIKTGDKQPVVITCYAGCEYRDILSALGIAAKDVAAKEDRRPLRVRSPDMSKAHPVQWIWHQRLPEGYLSLLLGEEGIGKGALICWVIARLSRGDLPGDYQGEAVHVGIIGDEDDFDSVWTPRLKAGRADFGCVHYIDRENFDYIELKADQDRIATVVEAHGIRFLFLDQLLDNLGVNVDNWRDKQVREALKPARALARTLEIGVTGALHPNKRGNSFRELLSGSAAFNAVSRSSMLLTRRLDDYERRVLVRGKRNLCPEPSAFEFDITEFRFDAHGEPFSGPLVDNTAHSDLTKGDLVGIAATADAETKVGQAEFLIMQMLPNDGKGHACRPILTKGEEQGLEYQTMYRAKRKLGLDDYRDAAFQGESFWKWPIKVTLVKRARTQ